MKHYYHNCTDVTYLPGSVQLIRPVRVLSLVVAHSTARSNRQPYLLTYLLAYLTCLCFAYERSLHVGPCVESTQYRIDPFYFLV